MDQDCQKTNPTSASTPCPGCLPTGYVQLHGQLCSQLGCSAVCTASPGRVVTELC